MSRPFRLALGGLVAFAVCFGMLLLVGSGTPPTGAARSDITPGIIGVVVAIVTVLMLSRRRG